MATQQPQQAEYPVRFSVDYPDRDLNRVTTAFRILTIIIDINVNRYIKVICRKNRQKWRFIFGGVDV